MSIVPLFFSLRVLDVVDILLVALILFQIYLLIRGTGAISILFGILSVYIVYWLVGFFEMKLLSAILSQFVSLGVIALIIVFQPEIRKYLLMLGNKNFIKRGSENLFSKFLKAEEATKLDIFPIVIACTRMSNSNTGAIIVLTKQNELQQVIETGQVINATISSQLLETIFFKNTPMHDGAVIISNNKVVASKCVLPVSENKEIPSTMGLRHKAAAGVTEQSDALAIVVSEQTGKIALFKQGKIHPNLKPEGLKAMLIKEFWEKE